MCPLNPVQRAFIPADGVAENAFLLDAFMRKTEHERQPLAVAWIDVAKAFDSVSHDSIGRAAARIGMPLPIVDVIRRMYNGSTTEIRRETRIQTTRGVEPFAGQNFEVHPTPPRLARSIPVYIQIFW